MKPQRLQGLKDKSLKTNMRREKETVDQRDSVMTLDRDR